MTHWLEKSRENPAFIEALEKLAITPDNATLISILPLVYVAWADGVIQAGESKAIFEAAGELGIGLGSGEDLLASWLDSRPSHEFFSHAFNVIARSVEMLDDLERLEDGYDLVDLCEKVAKAAGGFLGLFTVCAQEKVALKQIKQCLKIDESRSAKQLFKDLHEKVSFYDK